MPFQTLRWACPLFILTLVTLQWKMSFHRKVVFQYSATSFISWYTTLNWLLCWSLSKPWQSISSIQLCKNSSAKT